MTHDKARKADTRQRMAATGEPYSVARHAVQDEHETPEDAVATPRDDDWNESVADEAGIGVDEFRAQEQADQARRLADRARDLAEQARERAERAEEAATAADEAADLTQKRPN